MNSGAFAVILIITLIVGGAVIMAAVIQSNDFRTLAKQKGFTVEDVAHLELSIVHVVSRDQLFEIAKNLGTTTIYYDKNPWGDDSRIYFAVANGTEGWTSR